MPSDMTGNVPGPLTHGVADELHVWRDGEHVGVFTRRRGGGLVELHYDTADVPALSLSMPNGPRIAARRPAAWLEGLLPENPRLREVIARQHGSSIDVFDLLQHVGADVAGAVSLLSAGREPGDATDVPVQVSEVELRRAVGMIRSGAGIPDVVVGSRMSVAGAQDKFSIARVGDRWFLPTAGLPSTHIIKPAQQRHPGLDGLEVASLNLARGIGLPAARAVLFEGAFMVERFDRDVTRAGTRRRHMEDLSQSLGLPPGRKYGVSAKQVVDLLREHATHEQVMGFIARLVFNTHLGNADAHAKNYSVFLDTPSPVLTPLYDTIPLAAFPHFDQQLAMKIGGARYAAEVTPHHWAKLARTTGLDPDEVTHLAVSIAEAIGEQASEHGLAEAVRVAVHGMPTPSTSPDRTSSRIARPGTAVDNTNTNTHINTRVGVQGSGEATMDAPETSPAEESGPGMGGVWVSEHLRNGHTVHGYWRRGR